MKFVGGNSARLLKNGEEYFPALLKAIESAKTEILFQTYIFTEDFIGLEIAEALKQAVRLGVRVHICLDGFGSQELSKEFLENLKKEGVRLKIFKPLSRFYWLGTSNIYRLHRKIAVIDSEVAFIGGINVCEDQLFHSPNGRLDYACRLEGPIVTAIQRYCRRFHFRMENRWKTLPMHLQILKPFENKPEAKAVGSAEVAFQLRDNFKNRRQMELTYRKFFKTAQEEIVIAMAYFFPGLRFLFYMRRAARKRKLPIKLIVQGKSEFRTLKLATQFIYPKLIRAGIEIYEYEPRYLHAKVCVVDGKTSIVGSGNLDPMSLFFNLEANAIINDPDLTKDLRADLEIQMKENCRKIEEPPSSWGPQIVIRFFAYLLLRYAPLLLVRLSRRSKTARRPPGVMDNY